jgi:hypothetical protein
VTNITGNAQLECAAMNSSVGCTNDSMVLYIGDRPRHDGHRKDLEPPTGPKGFIVKGTENDRTPCLRLFVLKKLCGEYI